MTRFIQDTAKAITRGPRAKGWRALWRDRDGAAAVEFAFILPILLLLFSGIVQFGSVMFLENHMTNVARETSRRIAVGELAQADAASSAQQALVNWGVTYDVSVATIDVGSGNQDITVAISLPMHEAALMDVLGVFQSGNLTAAVTMRQES
jgi:Flp pilus assembly protein TadG